MVNIILPSPLTPLYSWPTNPLIFFFFLGNSILELTKINQKNYKKRKHNKLWFLALYLSNVSVLFYERILKNPKLSKNKIKNIKWIFNIFFLFLNLLQIETWFEFYGFILFLIKLQHFLNLIIYFFDIF